MKNLIFTVISLFIPTSLFADWQMNMPKGVTPISNDIYNLHMLAIWICLFIGVVVFGIMIYSMIVHRKSRGYKASTFHEHPFLEVIWAVIPIIIIIILAIPATRILIAMDDNSEADIDIKIIGKQWYWEYQYLDHGIQFSSHLSTPVAQLNNEEEKGEFYLLEVDNPLVLPVNKKVRFLVTSGDVIHSWWVSDFAVKRDAVPGYVYETWAFPEQTGTFRGQCAELCGIRHGFMPIVVKVVEEEEFYQWIAEKNPNARIPEKYRTTIKEIKESSSYTSPVVDEIKEPKIYTKANLISSGEKIYQKYCMVCHQDKGQGMLPAFPALKGFSRVLDENSDRVVDLLLYGVAGTAMQSFSRQLNNEEMASVVTYIRNAWGNNTGDLVLPEKVEELREIANER